MAVEATSSILQFATWQSSVDVSFWEKLASLKVDSQGLTEEDVAIHGFFTPSSHSQLPSFLSLSSASFPPSPAPPPRFHLIQPDGTTNTSDSTIGGEMDLRRTVIVAESFRAFDRWKMMEGVAQQLWQDVLSGKAEKHPSLLNAFFLLVYPDIKHWRFHYAFAFPALALPAPATLAGLPLPATQAFSPELAEAIEKECERWRQEGSGRGPREVEAAALTGEAESPEGGKQDGNERAVTDGEAAENGEVDEGRQGEKGNESASGEIRTADSAAAAAAVVGETASEALLSEKGAPFFLLQIDTSTTNTSSAHPSVTAHPLTEYQRLATQSESLSSSSPSAPPSLLVAFFDPCHLPLSPGWPLRNLLLLASLRWQATSLHVLCLRQRHGRISLHHSLLLHVQIPPPPADWLNPITAPATCPSATGWELNAKGRTGARCADLAPLMDPARLADEAASLNLKLMRWRVLPQLQLERLNATKCLLLGAGTLGCQVARSLLAWGIRDITLVDYGAVSYSNPVRQCLFTVKHCLNGGVPKAQAAAEALKEILPAARTSGHRLAIPMPGHPVSPSEAPRVQADVAALLALIRQSDTVFLLTDTRESRWLPTLLCAAEGKVAINAALGFDSFLVMRHGAPPPLLPHATSAPAASESAPAASESAPSESESASAASESAPAVSESAPAASESAPAASESAPSKRLGCYFCNDVVAPLNSMAHRTLDQQCTVTRPGLATIAGALAVELLVGLLHHPLGFAAPPEDTTADGFPSSTSTSSSSADLCSPLGPLPHQLRGFLSSFSQLPITGFAFHQCTACSPTVVSAYRERGFAFLMDAFNDPTYLERITGLDKLHAATVEIEVDWDDSEDDNTGIESTRTARKAAVTVPIVLPTLLPNNRYNAKCLDGSPPGYYFRPGFRNGASSWHIHLPPGGWCSSLSACANRSTTFLGSSKPERQKDSPYSNASYAYLGILSTGPYVNRAFRNWNLVVPIYCDGGGFQGTAGWVKVNSSFGIYMDGWNGIKAVLADVKELRGMQSAERVLLSGQSAGAQTVLTLCEHMREYAPNAKTIKCLMDSGSFTDSNDRYGQPFFQRMASDIVALHKFTGSTKCAQAYSTSERWHCFFPQYALPFIPRSLPLFVINSLFDYRALMLGNQLSPTNQTYSVRCVAELLRLLPNLTVQSLTASSPRQLALSLAGKKASKECTSSEQLAALWAGQNVGKFVQSVQQRGKGSDVFIPVGIEHCVIALPYWNRLRVDGVRLCDAVVSWYLQK
ncbi:unnamed protein product [Closterium sp. Naga37s-1]|nr:unnamed protein product [Closterium sp. Naga37s-1]